MGDDKLTASIMKYIDNEECDQCGAKRAKWQEPEEVRCPNHAHPYHSCDGVLRAPRKSRALP